ncbi:C-type lectin domain family 12 member A [Zalophus californianus]|uniref:C-type lectin domain family 12 member A n=1 Tax=Zalophus californianus TaxID=9704 RepID=A0A6J2D6G8_ZALCA|nr:C-type lectin domain family 12 member A [Zalophus californianus]XP_027451506.1 C-type lectin domain family 12 member A [Zalophus californianus]XP_027451507.1 C-type lectin domain family 12 member A [Zalophus californianus]XP_027451508.1 C-type lectin domain family 12 member A [Zalophus californianus]
MSEEVTYADIKFQDSSKRENIHEFDTVGIKAPPAPSHGWRQRTLALTLLCLLLLIGLGVLGSFFYTTLKIEMGKLNKLQNFKEELQRNVSLQLIHNMNNSKMIMDLSNTLQEIATRLCHELYKREPEHKCKPCPKTWMWHEDSCYILIDNYETWQESVMFCSAQNASLLTIKNKSVLEFIKSKRLRRYWLGLSTQKYQRSYQELDETIISSNWITRNRNVVNGRMHCGYIDTVYVYYTDCSFPMRFICQKLADPVKIESEIPDGKYS